jgi:hypothetical protein
MTRAQRLRNLAPHMKKLSWFSYAVTRIVAKDASFYQFREGFFYRVDLESPRFRRPKTEWVMCKWMPTNWALFALMAMFFCGFVALMRIKGRW